MARCRRAAAQTIRSFRWGRAALVPVTVAIVTLAVGAGHAASPGVAAPSAGAVAPSADDAAALVAQILGRPLFTPGRRPPPPIVPAPPPIMAVQPKRTWDWRLAGIMTGPDKREALFVRDGVHIAMGQGEDIDGWTVVAIGPDNVQIDGDDGKKLLHPQPDPTADAAAGSAKNPKPGLKPVHHPLPTALQSRVALLSAAKKSLEEENKRGKLQLHPRGPPQS